MCTYLFFHLPACMLSPFSHVWFFVIPWTIALQVSLSMGFSRQEFGRVLCPFPGNLHDPGIEPRSLIYPALEDRSLPLATPGKPPFSFTVVLIFVHLINYSRELSILTIFKDPTWASLIAQLVKNSPAVQETPVWFLGKQVPWRRNRLPTPVFLGFPCGSDGKEPTCNAGDLGSVLGL